MRRSLLPLNALRTFEAAGRHGRFDQAARELNVTPAAVSHQVRGLEERLGVALFHRRSRGLALTAAGKRLLPELGNAFAAMERAVGDALSLVDERTLTVSAAPAIAAKWLLPRLQSFQDRHPDLEVRISSNPQIVDFASGDVDVALRYGKGGYGGLHWECIMAAAVFPVASPALVDGDPPLREPADLARHVLLHDDSWSPLQPGPDWDMWLRAAGVSGVEPTRGPRFDNAIMAVESAALGRGVALAAYSMASDDLASGRLVRPFDIDLDTGFGVYLVCPRDALERKPVAAFRDWIVETGGEFDRRMRSLRPAP